MIQNDNLMANAILNYTKQEVEKQLSADSSSTDAIDKIVQLYDDIRKMLCRLNKDKMVKVVRDINQEYVSSVEHCDINPIERISHALIENEFIDIMSDYLIDTMMIIMSNKQRSPILYSEELIMKEIDTCHEICYTDIMDTIKEKGQNYNLNFLRDNDDFASYEKYHACLEIINDDKIHNAQERLSKKSSQKNRKESKTI